jgi:hypothetical protein
LQFNINNIFNRFFFSEKITLSNTSDLVFSKTNKINNYYLNKNTSPKNYLSSLNFLLSLNELNQSLIKIESINEKVLKNNRFIPGNFKNKLIFINTIQHNTESTPVSNLRTSITNSESNYNNIQAVSSFLYKNKNGNSKNLKYVHDIQKSSKITPFVYSDLNINNNISLGRELR